MGDTITNYRIPKRVKLTIGIVYLSSYFKADDQGVVARARDVLDSHNIALDVFPTNYAKSAWNTIDHTEYVPDKTEDYTEIYKKAKAKLKQMGCNHVIPLPVVFGAYVCSGYGIAPKVTGQLTRLVMISPTVNDDKMTLLHEIGHASDLHHDLTGGSPRNFMHEADTRTVMYKYQVEAVARAPFSVG